MIAFQWNTKNNGKLTKIKESNRQTAKNVVRYCDRVRITANADLHRFCARAYGNTIAIPLNWKTKIANRERQFFFFFLVLCASRWEQHYIGNTDEKKIDWLLHCTAFIRVYLFIVRAFSCFSFKQSVQYGQCEKKPSLKLAIIKITYNIRSPSTYKVAL